MRFVFVRRADISKAIPLMGGDSTNPACTHLLEAAPAPLRFVSTFWCFDILGSDVSNEGHPSINQFLGKYNRSKAIFKDAFNMTGELERLWGEYLPIISFYYPRLAGGFIEFTAVPKPDMEGSMEQDAFFRLQMTADNGTVLKAQFYDNYAYTAGAFQSPKQVPASGEPKDSVVANDFYATLLEQRRWWAAELTNEGIMGVTLPADKGTDGVRLHHMARHSIIRDITIAGEQRKRCQHGKFLATTIWSRR